MWGNYPRCSSRRFSVRCTLCNSHGRRKSSEQAALHFVYSRYILHCWKQRQLAKHLHKTGHVAVEALRNRASWPPCIQHCSMDAEPCSVLFALGWRMQCPCRSPRDAPAETGGASLSFFRRLTIETGLGSSISSYSGDSFANLLD